MKRGDKVAEIRRIARALASSKFLPESFSITRANPGASTVKVLLNEFGIKDPFSEIEKHFGAHYKAPFAAGLVAVTLSSIVDRRNEVAHEGYALGISRADLSMWLKFLWAFGRAADNTLRDHTLGLRARL